MDIVLDRVLSLIPKDPKGRYVHGAKKEFADSLGLAHNLVTMWEKGQSKSYRKYLYEISDKYNVSVEWLRGETDQKEKSPGDAEALSAEDIELVKWFRSLPEEKRQAILALAKD